jgi:hypothetical protein
MKRPAWLEFADPIELTPEEEEWWAELEPTFRRRALIRAGAMALLGVVAIGVARWLSGLEQLHIGVSLASFSTFYALFGLNVLKGELPTKRDKIITARRVEQAVIAEPDEPPLALPTSPAPARRFQ